MEDHELEELWDALLSRQPEQVREMYNSLGAEEQKGVFAHLQRMATEEGWHVEQRTSAIAALAAIEETNL